MRTLALLILLATALPAQRGPFDGSRFHGRIAWSADGNHNDEDDWAASPMALAIFAAFRVQDKLVHFDYNSILNNNDAEWEKTHEESVLGAVERFEYDRSRFFSDQRDLDKSIASLVAAINGSSADDPLYLVIAGPMEVAFRAIQQAEPGKRQFVYCISHSAWNDGFSAGYSYNFTKHDVIQTGVKWVQIRDQNRFLSTSPFGRPATDEEWTPFHWLRDSGEEKIRFLWHRLRVSTRADCSDAGMAYFLMTGDEDSEIAKVRALLVDGKVPKPLDPRPAVRLEAENAAGRENLEVEFNRANRGVSHRMHVKLSETGDGTLRMRFAQPYTAPKARYAVHVRYLDEADGAAAYQLALNGKPHGDGWRADANDGEWKTQILPPLEIASGDELTLTIARDGAERGGADYIELHRAP